MAHFGHARTHLPPVLEPPQHRSTPAPRHHSTSVPSTPAPPHPSTLAFCKSAHSDTTARRMSTSPHTSAVVGKLEDLLPGASRKFLLTIHGSEEECFVVNHGGQLYAYVNRCCHVPMTMDWIDNRFFDESKQFILCATHGACYEPDTGECVSGPPLGKVLTRVPVEVVDGEIVAHAPDAAAKSK